MKDKREIRQPRKDSSSPSFHLSLSRREARRIINVSLFREHRLCCCSVLITQGIFKWMNTTDKKSHFLLPSWAGGKKRFLSCVFILWASFASFEDDLSWSPNPAQEQKQHISQVWFYACVYDPETKVILACGDLQSASCCCQTSVLRSCFGLQHYLGYKVLKVLCSHKSL